MARKPKDDQTLPAPIRFPDVLDAYGAAALLTVSVDLVYQLFASGELPGRKVGRKWLTTKSAVLRWVESSSSDAAMSRAIRNGDSASLFSAMNRGKVRAAKRV